MLKKTNLYDYSVKNILKVYRSIKDLAYIQIFDIAVIFQIHFKSLKNVNNILNWKYFPEEVIFHFGENTKKQSSNEDFNTGNWSEAEWLEW